MLIIKPIVGLASALALTFSLSACGQKGVLVLPKEPAAQGRATLPQVLNPATPAASPASSPVR
jgi:predicted small lipoprotein YifL